MFENKSCSPNHGARNVNIKLPLELYNKLSFVCNELGLTRGEVIRELLYDSLPTVVRFIESGDCSRSFVDKSSSLKNFHASSIVMMDELF